MKSSVHSEESWHALAENWPGSILTIDGENRVLSLNRSTRTMDPERDLGRDIFDFIQEDTRADVYADLAAVRAGAGVVTRRVKVPFADGTTRWFESRFIPLRDSGVMIVNNDVTDEEGGKTVLRLLAEASHEFSGATDDYERLLAVIARRLSEITGDLCSIRPMNEDGSMLEPGTAHYRVPEIAVEAQALLSERSKPLGAGPMGRVAVSGQALFIPDISKADFAAKIKLGYRQLLDRLNVGSVIVLPMNCRGKVVGVVSLMRPATEPPYTEQDLHLIRNLVDHGALALANARSHAAERAALAAAVNANQALQSTGEQLRQAQKMEAIGRLAGGVAHDFNNLLSVILSYSELVLADLKPADPNSADVAEIRKAARQAADLTMQLLVFSRQQVIAPKVLDLNDVIVSVDKLVRRLVGEDIDLKSSPAPKLGKVMADRSSIEQVVMNLVVNARDAMPKGGKLTIETANVQLDADYANEHTGTKAGPHVMLAVSDTGVGMDRATRERVFEPFFTTKEVGKGSGLGLSTVFGIVQQSGGSIWVYSEVGKGTVFKVYLPRVEAEVEAANASVSPPPMRGSETVLLVEDQEQVRAVAHGILRRNGYRVLVAQHAGEALLACEKHEGPIHLLLTDVVMPQMSGAELAQRVLALRPELKVLYMSGYTDDSILRHGVLESELAFLQKPFTPESLTSKVREVIGASSANGSTP